MTTQYAKMGRTLIRRQFEALGFDIVRRTAKNGQPIVLLPLLINYCVLAEGKGAVIQVGANDGVIEDPVCQTIKALSLPALLVEPLPDKFLQLRQNYRDRPNVRFENVAVSTEPGEAVIYRFNPAAKNLPSWAAGIASLDKNVLLKHRHDFGITGKDIDFYIESVRVPTVTFSQLMRKHPDIANPLVLQVDAEGYDFTIVKAAVEAGCLPKIINYEHKHLTFKDQTSCRELLSTAGYAFFSGFADTLAYRDSIAELPN